MSTTVRADFPAWVDAERRPGDPVRGRVLLGESQLVVAAEDTELRVPLSSVFDVTPGSVPQVLGPVPETPVTVAYEDDDGRAVLALAAAKSTVKTFVTVLFRSLLDDRAVYVKHPDRVGGRVVDAAFRRATLAVGDDAVRFEADDPLRVDLAAVTDFDRTTARPDGRERPGVAVDHVVESTAYRTLVATPSPRVRAVLGRYLRRQYDQLLASLEGVDLTEPAVETLVALYATRESDVALPDVVGADPGTVRGLLRSLHEEGLVERAAEGPALTTRGQVVVNHYMERVNG